MSVTILLVGLVVFAFFAAHLLNRYAVRYVPLSGVEYLLVGALIGPQIPPRVLSSASLEQLRPLVSLLLGLMGFLVGLQARGRPNRHTLTGTVIALATVLALAASFAAAYGALVSPSDPALIERTLFTIEGYRLELFLTREQCAIALVLAAIAGVTFSSSSAHRVRAEVPALQLLRQSALAGQWVAVATVALYSPGAVAHPRTARWGTRPRIGSSEQPCSESCSAGASRCSSARRRAPADCFWPPSAP